jgi:hypothetical protein
MTRRAAPGACRIIGSACIIAACTMAWSAAWGSAGSGSALHAQVPGDTVTIVAGARYEVAGLARVLTGANWRDLWVQPIRVPVLDVRTFAGGLTPLRSGGGNQSVTLHFTDAAGTRWLFRSIDKFPGRGLAPEMQDTPAGDIVQDHISALNPGGHFVMPALLAAAGILHALPRLYVMPDDPALGEYRADFAGMLGELEERPDEGPGNTPGFAGSVSIKNTGNFLDDLEDSAEHQLDEAEFLRARLVDFLVGDTDRGTDQWRFARFGDGPYTWRPIPNDRDWALVRADGALVRLARRFYPKVVRFGEGYPTIEAMTYSSHVVDRRLLTRLTRSDFTREAAFLRQAITDAVIDDAVAGMPPEYVALRGDEIASVLRARRDQLPAVADAFYDWLATEVDVRGTDEPDFAWIERRADGTVRVVLRSEAAPTTVQQDSDGAAGTFGAGGIYYDRVFLPGETREVRVYLHGGDDHARVVGTPDGPIRVRVIAGGGNDVLEDLAGGARFHDHRGDNRVIAASGTLFDGEPWTEPDPPEGLRANYEWAQDWGSDGGIGPAVTYRERAGFLLGAGAEFTRYGFRRVPHHWQASASAQYAPETGGVAAALELDYRMQSSRRSVHVAFDASRVERFRFPGFGNDLAAPAVGGRTLLHRLRFTPSLVWQIGRRPGEPADAAGADDEASDDEDEGGTVRWAPDAPRRLTGSFEVGPAFAWTNPRLADAADFAVTTDAVTQIGVRALLDVRRTDRSAAPRRGFRVHARAAGYPFVTGATQDAAGAGRGDMAAHLAASVATYVPLIADGLHLALRAGGEHAFGAYPFFDAAFLGGRHSLRGLPAYRYAGDAAAFGGAELRMPLDSVVLLVRMETGVFAFADAGRVWHGGASPGGWHTGVGGGAWFAAFGRAASIAVARGEGTRVYAWFGLPF